MTPGTSPSGRVKIKDYYGNFDRNNTWGREEINKLKDQYLIT
jgi:hypothetical protein